MDEQLSETLAAEITSRYSETLDLCESAKKAIEDARQSACHVGQLTEKAKELYHSSLHQWFRDYVPTVPIEAAEKFMSMHKIGRRRDYVEVDSRQLKFLGITGDDGMTEHGGTNKGQRSGGDRWVKWAGHIVHHFKDIEEDRPINQWEDFERRALVDALRPIVELYSKASGGRNAIIS